MHPDGDDRIQRRAGASGFGEHKFRRRILALVGADRPVGVVQVEHRRHRHDVHVGFVVGLQRPHVAPVERFLLVLVDEIVGVNAVLVDHLGQNVFAEVVAGIRIFRILQQHRNEHVGVEQINAHRCRKPCRDSYGERSSVTACGFS